MKIFGKINLKYYMSLSVLNYIHVPLFNIDMSLFCIDMNIEAHFYRYINISDINDSSKKLFGKMLKGPKGKYSLHYGQCTCRLFRAATVMRQKSEGKFRATVQTAFYGPNIHLNLSLRNMKLAVFVLYY